MVPPPSQKLSKEAFLICLFLMPFLIYFCFFLVGLCRHRIVAGCVYRGDILLYVGKLALWHVMYLPTV